LLIFKTRSKNEEKLVGDARFFKPASRNAKNGKFVEVDEKAALKSEDFVLPSVPVLFRFLLDVTSTYLRSLTVVLGQCGESFSQKFVRI
jgi:hypothetical protein